MTRSSSRASTRESTRSAQTSRQRASKSVTPKPAEQKESTPRDNKSTTEKTPRAPRTRQQDVDVGEEEIPPYVVLPDDRRKRARKLIREKFMYETSVSFSSPAMSRKMASDLEILTSYWKSHPEPDAQMFPAKSKAETTPWRKARREAFDAVVASTGARIREHLLSQTLDPSVTSIVKFLAGELTGSNALERSLPLCIVETGYSIPDQDLLFDRVQCTLENDTSAQRHLLVRVACHSSHTVRDLLATFRAAVDRDALGDGTSRRASPDDAANSFHPLDMERLVQWHTSSEKRLIVVFQCADVLPPQVVSDTLQLLAGYRYSKRLPGTICVFGTASTPSLLSGAANRLPSTVRVSNVSTANEYNVLMHSASRCPDSASHEHVPSLSSTSFWESQCIGMGELSKVLWMGPKTLRWLRQQFVRTHCSATTFFDQLKYVLFDFFYDNEFSLLSTLKYEAHAKASQAQSVLATLTSAQCDRLRQLPSVRKHIENGLADHPNLQAELLMDDAVFRSHVTQWLADLVDYERRFSAAYALLRPLICWSEEHHYAEQSSTANASLISEDEDPPLQSEDLMLAALSTAFGGPPMDLTNKHVLRAVKRLLSTSPESVVTMALERWHWDDTVQHVGFPQRQSQEFRQTVERLLTSEEEDPSLRSTRSTPDRGKSSKRRRSTDTQPAKSSAEDAADQLRARIMESRKKRKATASVQKSVESGVSQRHGSSQTAATAATTLNTSSRVYPLVEWLLRVFEECLRPMTGLPLYECVTYDKEIRLEMTLQPNVRECIQHALRTPEDYLDFSEALASNVSSAGNKSTATPQVPLYELPDVSLAYRIFADSGRLISLYDWLVAFTQYILPPRSGSKNDAPEPQRPRRRGRARRQALDERLELAINDHRVQARFFTAVAALQWMGFIRPTHKKADHMERQVFDLPRAYETNKSS